MKIIYKPNHEFNLGDTIQVQSRHHGVETGVITWKGFTEEGRVIYNTKPAIAIAKDMQASDFDIELIDIVGTPENLEFYS